MAVSAAAAADAADRLDGAGSSASNPQIIRQETQSGSGVTAAPLRLLLVFSAAVMFSPAQAGAEVTRRDVIERYLVPSSVTAGGGYDWAKPQGGTNDLLFEADLNQHLHYQPLWFNNRSFFKINPRVRLRMLALESSPVRTPSFMPNLTWFFGFGNAQAEYRNEGFTYYSVMLSHHSNGQAGDFYSPDGAINTETGSFSTNFLEFGINRVWSVRRFEQAWSRLSLIWHPGFNRNDELDDQYERLKIALATSTTRGLRLWTDYSFEAQAYVAYTPVGKDYTFIPGSGSSAPRKDAEWYDRTDWGFLVSFGNDRSGDFRWFLKFDYGYDYYNINFFQPIRRLQIGIMGDPFD